VVIFNGGRQEDGWIIVDWKESWCQLKILPPFVLAAAAAACTRLPGRLPEILMETGPKVIVDSLWHFFTRRRKEGGGRR